MAFSMKVVSTLVFFIIFNYVHGKPVSSGNNNQTCPRKDMIKYLCDNVKRDMATLYTMVKKVKRGHPKSLSHTKNMFSNFSTVKKLGKHKIVERLFFIHNILGDGYGFFGKNKSSQLMKAKTLNIVIQIKALAEILQNNTDCNPGKPGNQFKFNLPKDKSMNTDPSFLYHFLALLKEMQPEFEKKVVKQFKFT